MLIKTTSLFTICHFVIESILVEWLLCNLIGPMYYELTCPEIVGDEPVNTDVVSVNKHP